MNQLATISHDTQNLPATLDKIESAIAIASKPEEINSVLALMDAAVAYAKRYYKDQADVIQRAKGLRLQAERRLGEILRDMPKATGVRMAGRDAVGGYTSEPPKESPTLAEIGIDKRTSSRAQKLAALPETKFAAVVSGEIAVAKAIAKPVKKHTAKTRAVAAVDAHKAIVADEGSTYLISAMRSALKAVEGAGDDFQEYDKTMAMAKRLQVALSLFLTEQESEQAALQSA